MPKTKLPNPVARITTISRGADLTEADLYLLVDDFYEVRNWAALQARMDAAGVKEQLFCALEVRLGRRPQTLTVEE